MADSHKDRRLTEASTLSDAIESLTPVDPTKRMGFIHDQLISTIDGICKTHGSRAFTPTQLTVIKDISFQIVHLLHHVGRPEPKGFVSAFKKEWKEKSPMTKIGAAAGAVVFVGTAITCVYHFGSEAWAWWTAKPAVVQTQSKPQATQATSQPAAPSAPTPTPNLFTPALPFKPLGQ